MTNESRVSRISPESFVRGGGGSGFNGNTTAHRAVVMVLVRHDDSWEAAFDEIIDIGLSDEDIWSGGWLAEWFPDEQRDLRSKLAARRQARKDGSTEAGETTVVPGPTTAAGTEAPGDLPGDLTWQKIQTAYRNLAPAEAGRRFRRRRPHEPSRPEVAKMLGVSPSTLKRACDKAGMGTRWPPADI